MTEARPSNSFLFPDLDVLFALDTEALMTYLSPHHKAICNSVKKNGHHNTMSKTIGQSLDGYAAIVKEMNGR